MSIHEWPKASRRDAAKVSGYAEGAIFFQYQLRENSVRTASAEWNYVQWPARCPCLTRESDQRSRRQGIGARSRGGRSNWRIIKRARFHAISREAKFGENDESGPRRCSSREEG